MPLAKWASIVSCLLLRQARVWHIVRHCFIIVCFIIATFMESRCVHADGDPMTSMLGRTTSASGIDLCESLLTHREFGKAKSLCQWQRKRFHNESDGYARWTAQLAYGLIAEQIESSHFNESAIQTATVPLQDWLKTHPTHPRRVFIKQAILEVRRQAIETQVAMAAVSRHESSAVKKALKNLVKLRLDFDKVADQIRDEIASRESSRELNQRIFINDLKTSRQTSLVATVALAVMETELFAPGSNDQIASSADAERLADQTLIELGSSKGATREIDRMRVQCLIIQDRIADARQTFDQSESRFGKTISSNWVALHVELLLAEKKTKQAENLLLRSKGSSLSVHLARLRWLLATNQLDRATQWVESIEQHHGLFARRRAEVITLDDGLADDSLDGSSGLLVHQARQMIREGDHHAAGVLLSRIARQTQSPDQAIHHATTAAAAFHESSKESEASRVLIEVASLHPQNEAAGKMHLQGLVLESSLPNHEIGQTIVALREHLATWVTSASFVPARDWLIELLRQRGEFLQAAMVQSQTPPKFIDKTWSAKTYMAWQHVIKNAGPDRVAMISQSALQSLSLRVAESPIAAETLEEVAAILMERRELSLLPASSAEIRPSMVFARWRQGNDNVTRAAIEFASSLSSEKQADVRWRLLRDGERDRSDRGRIARIIESMDEPVTSAIALARLAFWRGDSGRGIVLVREFLSKQSDTSSLISAATLLSDSNAPLAKQEAVLLWDRLAAGAPKNSETWHTAKLESIRLLSGQGDRQGAAKRATYLLITNPNLTKSQKARYEAFIKK